MSDLCHANSNELVHPSRDFNFFAPLATLIAVAGAIPVHCPMYSSADSTFGVSVVCFVMIKLPLLFRIYPKVVTVPTV